MRRFMLEGTQPCTMFFFCARTLCLNDVTKTFLLISSLEGRKQ